MDVLFTLGELGCATSGFETVLLALLHTRIAGQETGLLQDGAVVLAGQQQGAGDTVPQGAGLAGHAAAGDGSHNVHLAGVAGSLQGLTDDHLQGLQAEILVDVTAVDGDRAGAVGEQMHTGHGGLAAAGAIQIRLLRLIHSLTPPYSSTMGF